MLLKRIVLIFSVVIFFASCSSFEKRRYFSGYYLKTKNNSTITKVEGEKKQLAQHSSSTVISIPEAEKKETPEVVTTNVAEKNPIPQKNKISLLLPSNESKIKTTATGLNEPDEDYETAKKAKGLAIAAIVLIFLFFYASIVLAILAIMKAKKVLDKHRYESDFKGKKEAEFALRTGKIIIAVFVLLAAIVTIALTIGFCELFMLLGLPFC